MAEPIAASPSVPITQAETLQLPAAQPPRKRRRWGWIVALIVVVALLIAAFFVADALARRYATGYVRDQIIQAMNLDPATPVDVDLGTGSLLLQAATGGINDVTVTIEEMAFGALTGSMVITASNIPLDSSRPVETLDIFVTFNESDVQKLAGYLSGIELNSIELSDGLITVDTEFSLLFVSVPVSVGLAPSASDGGISFEPQTITLADNEISVQDLRDNPLFSSLAGDLLSSRDFCVATYLPSALTVTQVDVADSTLVVTLNGDGVALGDPAFSTVGTCPPS